MRKMLLALGIRTGITSMQGFYKADIMPGVKARATVPVKAKYIHFNIGIRNNNKYNVLRGKQNFKNRSQFVMIDLEKK